MTNLHAFGWGPRTGASPWASQLVKILIDTPGYKSQLVNILIDTSDCKSQWGTASLRDSWGRGRAAEAPKARQKRSILGKSRQPWGSRKQKVTGSPGKTDARKEKGFLVVGGTLYSLGTGESIPDWLWQGRHFPTRDKEHLGCQAPQGDCMWNQMNSPKSKLLPKKGEGKCVHAHACACEHICVGRHWHETVVNRAITHCSTFSFLKYEKIVNYFNMIFLLNVENLIHFKYTLFHLSFSNSPEIYQSSNFLHPS